VEYVINNFKDFFLRGHLGIASNWFTQPCW